MLNTDGRDLCSVKLTRGGIGLKVKADGGSPVDGLNTTRRFHL